ncbi:uncharacterized protein LOC117651505 isoform X2 [Thrips palmi]|uniref:Uncharacterized protein LOC117651505 isoform X2 n=1 Tax=Thrips palmi TaxID=161013 RepID=A0A6P9A135_THRPL|nr:uncharacterized protein LOC117651505 isoform X2 [Thrips palmi]
MQACVSNVAFPPENLIRKHMNGRWLCKKGELNHMIYATLRLPKPTTIGRIDIGNFNSASVTVLVSRTGSKEFKELLPSRVLRTEADIRSGTFNQSVLMATCSDLREDTRHESWDLLKVVCCQPYRRPEDDPFGLSFISVWDGPNQSPGATNLNKFKEFSIRSSLPAKKEITFSSSLTRAQKMMMATKPPPTSPTGPESDDDFFKATVISFLETNCNSMNIKNPSDAKSELLQKLQMVMDRKFTAHEARLFGQMFLNHFASSKDRHPSRILTPRKSNNQLFSPGCQKMEDTKMSLLKPQKESFNSFNTQTVYFAEVVHNHPMKDGPASYLGRGGKENTPYLMDKNGLTNGDVMLDESRSPVLNSEKKMCIDQVKHDKFSPTWKNRNDIDKCDSRDCSPDTWLKRKSDPSERCQPTNKKRPRENTSVDESCNESFTNNRITPAGGWLLNGSGLHKKKVSPHDVKKQDSMKFPFRVSPPPPPDRPASPLSLVDDIDQPSTSSRETVAERNIRLDLERRLAERSPPERVVQRTSSGKVKGPFCTKGMNTNDSPLRRLSICEEGEEVGSPLARRKLSFVRPSNGQEADQDLVECPGCKSYFEACDIHKHFDECVPSPIKKPDDGENEDEMACPICGLWQPKDTVAAHADECAQKRYGA